MGKKDSFQKGIADVNSAKKAVAFDAARKTVDMRKIFAQHDIVLSAKNEQKSA